MWLIASGSVRDLHVLDTTTIGDIIVKVTGTTFHRDTSIMLLEMEIDETLNDIGILLGKLL